MYHEKMVLAIKSSGAVLREFGDTVKLPFGTEYSLLIKNLHARRAMANVQIDGVVVTNDVRLVIPANGEVELERFITNGNLEQGNRFKFIERNQRVEEARGIGAADGLVRLEFEYEREPVPIKTYYNYPSWPTTWYSSTTTTGLPAGSTNDWGSTHVGVPVSSNMVNTRGSSSGQAVGAQQVPLSNDAGITVPGSVSDQSFTLTSGFATDGVKHVIVLKLVGEVGGQQVVRPVTVKSKQKCTTCGHVNKATAKFCSECGTGLVIV